MKAALNTAGPKRHYSSPEVQKPILDALKAFKEEHGHLRMSQLYTTPQGMKLGARLRTLRRSFKLGELCDEFAQELLSMGVHLGPLRTEYYPTHDHQRPILEAIKAFKEEHGHVDVPAHYVDPQGLSLGQRLTVARRNNKNGRMNPAYREALERLGVRLTSQDPVRTYADFVDLLKVYKQNHGDCDVPSGYRDENGYALGGRCYNERRAAQDLNYPQARRSELAALGFRFDVMVADPTGEILLQRVAQFKAEHGHCKIGKKYVCEDGFTLGSRVSYVMRRGGKSGRNNLRDELLRLGVQRQAAALKGDYYADPEQQKPVLDAVKAFKKEHGHVDVPSRYIDPQGLKLGLRLTEARVNQKAGRLSPVFREALERLGVRLSSRDLVMPRDDFVALLKAYKQMHGDCDVPHGYHDEHGYSLGRRCYMERRAARKPDYPQARRRELDEMGFSFDVTVIDSTGDVLLQRVAQFKAEHGHCSIGKSYVCDDGFTLGNRVSHLMREREHPGRMALRNQLIELGVQSSRAPPKRAVEQIVRDVVHYIKAHGTTRVELRYQCQDGFGLGRWLYLQRALSLKGQEDREVRVRLEALGVSYDIVKRDGSVRKA